MGQAHCSVCNQTNRPLCVITFNMADLIYKSYHTMYIIESGDTQVVEANPDAIGLKLGLIYETRREKQEMLFHRFTCNNDSVLTIVSLEGKEIDHYGEGTTLNSKHKVREMDVDPFNMAADTLRSENAVRKAPTKVEQFVHKVVDTSENIAHKVVNTIEHPVEAFKGHRTGGSTTTAPESDSNSVMNDNNSINGNQNGQNSIASKFANFTNSIMNKEKGPPPRQAPPTPPPVEEDPDVIARKFEAEVRRAQNEQRWEAELARIKLDREMAEAEAMRREIEERELEEQRQLEEREAEEARRYEEAQGGKNKKKGNKKGEPEVVGGTGCACIVS